MTDDPPPRPPMAARPRTRRCHSSPRIRIRRVDVTPKEWIAHRKLRKKIASARWYRKKKRMEIAEENRLRQELADTLIRKNDAPIWTDERVQAGWQMSLDHMYRGYPACPDPERYAVAWCRATRNVEEWLCWRLPRTGERGCVGCHIPWGSRSDDRHVSPFLRTWRHLAMGEWWASEEGTGSGAYVGWTLSVLGAAFSAWQLQRERIGVPWSDIARTMYRVTTTSTMMDQYKPKPDPQRIPPHQNPTKNTHTTQPPPAIHRRDTLRHVLDWDDWIVWMNRFLFDSCETDSSRDDPTTTTYDDAYDTQPSHDEEEEEDEEEDDTWMDELLHTTLRNTHTTQPSLDLLQPHDDHPVSTSLSSTSNQHTGPSWTSPPVPITLRARNACCDNPHHTTLSGHDDAMFIHGCGGTAHTQSYLQEYTPWWHELPESSRWIYGITDPGSSNGSDDPESPGTLAEWSTCV